MTLRELCREAEAIPGFKSREDWQFDLSCMLEDFCHIPRGASALGGERAVLPEQAGCLLAAARRYAAGEPLQYLLGQWEFYGLPFYVGPGVLIPRADTETLAEQAIAFLKGRQYPAVADLCAGSGCIAAAIAAHCPDASVYALELSEDAFPYLERNIRRNGVKVTPLRHDVLCPPAGLPPLDLVVSNPPYISKEEMGGLDAQVLHEPEMALYGGEDGYMFYRELPALYLPLLKAGGAMALETGWKQAREVAALMGKAGYVDIRTAKDLCGVERVVVGYKAG